MEYRPSFFTNAAVKLQAVFFGAALFYFGKTLFVPVLFALLTAIVLLPVCRWFQKKGCSKAIAIGICLFIVTVVFGSLLLLLIWQAKLFSHDAPVIFNKAARQLQLLRQTVNNNFGITAATEKDWISKLPSGAANVLAAGFSAASSTLFILLLIPIYTALFLYHRKIFVEFLRMITPLKYQRQLEKILRQTVHTYFNYIKGMVLVYLIVGLLNSIGLFALGVRHALLFGMLCAIMTIIPYIGIIISALLPISVVWIDTGNILYPLGVVVVFTFVQYLEANVIFPKVVGTQLNLSTFAVLISIVCGGIVWGVWGMILFIPFTAIIKIISDNIEEWKPLNMLLGRK
jgi:predicted PurR-regulated permease PerM